MDKIRETRQTKAKMTQMASALAVARAYTRDKNTYNMKQNNNVQLTFYECSLYISMLSLWVQI
jgi:hypothetical protein